MSLYIERKLLGKINLKPGEVTKSTHLTFPPLYYLGTDRYHKYEESDQGTVTHVDAINGSLRVLRLGYGSDEYGYRDYVGDGINQANLRVRSWRRFLAISEQIVFKD